MTPFQLTALLLTVLWLVLVVRLRRSNLVLMAGLAALGVFTLASLALGWVTPDGLGLGPVDPWWATAVWALAGLVVTLAYSPLADRLASRWFQQPPNLAAFMAIQQSKAKLAAGILAAWLLGGFLEELIARGVVLKSVAAGLAGLPAPLAAGVAVVLAAAGAGLMHLYQGPRGAAIIAQISLLFGLLFVLSGYNLWAVMLCHGLYDTIAFIRFANRQSKYSK